MKYMLLTYSNESAFNSASKTDSDKIMAAMAPTPRPCKGRRDGQWQPSAAVDGS
jgi:hypothetical protein